MPIRRTMEQSREAAGQAGQRHQPSATFSHRMCLEQTFITRNAKRQLNEGVDRRYTSLQSEPFRF